MINETQTREKNYLGEQDLSDKKVLIILPHYNFRDKEYTWIRERLETTGVCINVASSHLSEAQGRFGTLVQPDFHINYVDGRDYDAFIFVGEEASNEYYGHQDIIRLLESAFNERKIVAAIGAAVPIIAYSGKLVSKKITSVEAERARLEEMGSFFTGKIVEQDGDIITANGPYGTREFGEAIVKALIWSKSTNKLSGRQYLR